MIRTRMFSLLLALAASVFSQFALAATGDQLAKLLPNDGEEFDQIGFSVAISGNRAIVGAPGDNKKASDGGAAYLYDVTSGSQLATLFPSDAAAFDGFGNSVAISGNTVVVGAAADDVIGRDSGSAYLFDVTTGAQRAKLLPADRAMDDYFGGSVAISGNIAIVGAPGDDDDGDESGSAYLFDVTSGNQIAKLLPNDGNGGDGFGSVAISGTTAIIGSSGDDDNGPQSGSAYLFDIITGTQIAKLVPSDGASSDGFGASVAISGNTAIVGSFGDDDKGLQSGAAYLFDVTTGAQLAKFVPSDGSMGDQFGISVAIDGNTAIIGAYGDDDNGGDSGSAYLFDIISGSQLAKLTSNDAEMDDQFGSSVAISGNRAIIGAFRNDDTYNSVGAAFLFDATSPVPEPAALTSFAVAGAVVLMVRPRRP